MKAMNNKNAGLKKSSKKALGKGLGALLPDIDTYDNAANEYFNCDVMNISPNRYQPRTKFSDKELEELSRSIQEQGIIQPLIVRNDDTGYELVAGERRLRAAKMAGLSHVPVIVKDISDSALLEQSIIENIQRENFTPMEESEAYSRLMGEFKMTQEEVAQKVGKSRPTIANFLRLKQLPEQIKESITEGTLSMGHARALLGADNSAQQLAAWKLVLSRALSVRQTEALIKQLKSPKEKKKEITPSNHYFSDIEGNLSRHFGTKVSIKKNGKKGTIAIEFYNDEDLDRLMSILDLNVG